MFGDRKNLSRRDFMKTSLMGLGSLWIAGQDAPINHLLEDQWEVGQTYGRVCEGKVNVYQRPSIDSPILSARYEDNIIPWMREVVGQTGTLSRRWVETSDGFVYAPRIQPVRYQPNEPLSSLPDTALGQGMWAEVTVPYVPVVVSNPPARAPWVRANPFPRFYYSQIFWINNITTDADGRTFYHAVQKWGYGDDFWVRGEAFRPLTAEELSPIHPEAENKRMRVSISYQILSCLEDNREVYFCRVSTGQRFDAFGEEVDDYATPLGPNRTWRKLISHHMSGGVTGAGWDLPGIGYTILFSGGGEAIHSTFWHNDFGTPRSRGCINVAPDDAKWIFRWSEPYIPYDVGDLTVSMPGGTVVEVVQ
jgi:hypothetical protein